MLDSVYSPHVEKQAKRSEEKKCETSAEGAGDGEGIGVVARL